MMMAVRPPQHVQGRLDLGLGLQVEVGGGLVQHDHPGTGQEGPGQGEKLRSPTPGTSPLVNEGVDAPGHALDQLG